MQNDISYLKENLSQSTNISDESYKHDSYYMPDKTDSTCSINYSEKSESIHCNKFDFDTDTHSNHEICNTHRNVKTVKSQYNEIICKICFNNNPQNELKTSCDNFIILSCNHTFHIKCLAEIQFNDMFKFHVIDSEYFKTRKCMVCTKQLEVEELLFLHSKFLANTKNMIETHDSSIQNLEIKLKKLKDDLRNSYEYRNKLQHERQKSKEIVATLTMMI